MKISYVRKKTLKKIIRTDQEKFAPHLFFYVNYFI